MKLSGEMFMVHHFATEPKPRFKRASSTCALSTACCPTSPGRTGPCRGFRGQPLTLGFVLGALFNIVRRWLSFFERVPLVAPESGCAERWWLSVNTTLQCPASRAEPPQVPHRVSSWFGWAQRCVFCTAQPQCFLPLAYRCGCLI